jgi:hypothetical protein
MGFQFDAEKIKRALEQAGFDVQIGDGVYARREQVTPREIYIDRGGRLRLTETTQPEDAQTRTVTRGPRRYALLVENQRVTTIVTQLANVKELGRVLEDLDALLSDTSGGASG